MILRSRAAAQSGFSIIEMMVGVALVTVSFVGMAPLVISTNHVTEAVSENEIARTAEFFSFGTNDLTQTTFGLSRDDASNFLPAYEGRGVIENAVA